MSAEEIEGHPAGEGIVKRSAGDAAQAAHSLSFVIAEVFAAGIGAAIGALILADPNATTLEKALVSGLSVVVGLVVILLALFAWKLLRAPVGQRDEARRQITPGFPRHALEIEPAWYGDIDVTQGEPPDRVIFLPISYTNREPQRRVSLDFELITQRAFAGGEWSTGMRIYPYTRRRTSDTLQTPLSVEPETRIRGLLLLDGRHEDLALDFDEGGTSVAVKNHWRVTIRVIDHVSGARMEEEFPQPFFKSRREEEEDASQQDDS